ncbi:hypothetical protein TSOC_010632 [Tetrabaena socialis]|uniref:Chalcone-flavonone isomerase family protein n=1 Tax=Tetrabaena socialis TaxID=47790 RepID=A0A2J7ZSS5_9CHLO|nr:hypothetical protein TSOC_010632 [Tetrabaena socialis]|eukprot:PNH03324.1 hypothetical protein TSOC_010632 [Tetrabaena socialis]
MQQSLRSSRLALSSPSYAVRGPDNGQEIVMACCAWFGVCQRGSAEGKAAPRARRHCRGACLPVQASLKVIDTESGVSHLLAQKYWQGEPYRCLGAATRLKKIAFFNVQIYSIAAYVEADRAAKELGVRERGGFFETDDDYCSALLDGAFNKVISLHLTRDITGEQFTDAINKTLLPRMQLAGDTASLDIFNNYFNSKSLGKDCEVLLLWSMAGDLELLVTPPVTEPYEYDTAKPELRISSAALGRGLFELFLGSTPVVPGARAEWVKGAKLLVESESVKRASRKSPLSTRPTEPRTKIGTASRHDKFAGGQFELRHLGGTSKTVTTGIRSGFGLQPSSRAQSAPSVQFGARFKMDHEAGESKQSLGAGTQMVPRYGNPGPGAYTAPRMAPDSVGKQTLSNNPTAAYTRVGTENRFGQFKDNFATPSPGAFKPSAGWLGDAPTYSFHGQGKRADVQKGMVGNISTAFEDPGPGTYEAPSALFGQASSKKPTAARARIGTSERDRSKKVFVSKGHERENFGLHSPSPSNYSPNMLASSTKRTPGGWKFGSGDRFSEISSQNGKNLKIMTPGPGSYVV